MPNEDIPQDMLNKIIEIYGEVHPTPSPSYQQISNPNSLRRIPIPDLSHAKPSKVSLP